MNMDEAHRLLGVERGVSDEDLKRAFKKKAFEFHPDRNSGSASSSEMFSRVSSAYMMISKGEGSEGTSQDDANRAWSDVQDNFRDHFPSGSPPSSESEFVEMFSSIFGQYLDDRVPGGFRPRVDNVVRGMPQDKKAATPGPKNSETPICQRCGHRGGGGRIVIKQGFRSTSIKCPRCG